MNYGWGQWMEVRRSEGGWMVRLEQRLRGEEEGEGVWYGTD